MGFIDYYKTLELTKTAGEADIKKAYRRLARKFHPDLNPNDASAKKKFQEINEAHEVLSDPEKRKKYDKYGKDWQHGAEYEQARRKQQQQYGGSGRGTTGGFDFGGGGDFSDFFESMFGGQAGSGQRGQRPRYKGQDINAELHLNLTDVYKSQQQTLTVNGKNIRLTIPAGVENGQTIRIKGHGGQGVNGGPNGDLYISFSITNNTKFKREGNTLYASQPLNLYTAILGGEVLVETIEGKVKLKVAPETKPGTKVKLKGKGFPVYKHEGEFGDMIVTFDLTIPSGLTEKEKELFTELSNLRSDE
jgi:curved DNA-binding protein